MHLDFAERLRVHPQLQPEVNILIGRERPAFYLGNIAADYQTICDIPREVTHFYPLPPPAGHQAHTAMLSAYPQLADAHQLGTTQAVFIAGYAFHLIQDMNWYWQVLIPYFIQSDQWPAERKYRFISHNALLTYLDGLSREKLPPDTGRCLSLAAYQGWLPFAADQELRRWQEMIVQQLQPGGNSETASIYAQRMGIPIAEFKANLNNPAWLQSNIFDLVPVAAVEAILDQGVTTAVRWTNNYLAPITGRGQIT
jgi:hypothetical protein